MLNVCLKQLIANKITNFESKKAVSIKHETVLLLGVKSWRRPIITTNNQNRALTNFESLELCERQVQYSA